MIGVHSLSDADKAERRKAQKLAASRKFRAKMSPEQKEYYRAQSRAWARANPKGRRSEMPAEKVERIRAYARAYMRKYNAVPERRERQRQWQRKASREHSWELKRSHGIDREEKRALADAQNNQCAGCARAFVPDLRNAHVDHDHALGRGRHSIRGLLCRQCNLALGLLRDSSITLRRLADYLVKR